MKLKIPLYALFFAFIAVSCNESIIDTEPLTQEQPHPPPLKSSSIGTNYYVAKTGSNSNPGTLLKPFLTIQKGLDIAKAGDTVFAKVGTYPEYVKFQASGITGHPIVLKNYGRDLVTVDGQSARVYCIYTNKKSNIVVDGINARNATSYNILISEGSNIMIKNLKSVLPLNPVTSPFCILLQSTAVWSKNIILQNCNTYGGYKGIYVNEKNNGVTVKGGEISYSKTTGLSVGCTSDTVVAPHNVVIDGVYSHHNSRSGLSSRIAVNVTFRNCHASYNAATGIQVEAMTYNSIVEDNLCEYNSRSSEYETGIWIFNSTGSIVRRNILRGNQTGLRIGQVVNFIAYNNLIMSNNHHPVGHLTTRNTSGVDFSESSGRFYNNVLYGNSAPDSKMGSIYVHPEGISNISIKNNIVMNDGSSKDMYFDASAGSTIISDFNLIYNENRIVNIQLSRTNYTWAAYKKVTKQDANSINTDPKFIDEKNNNFKLKSASPAIITGTEIGLTNDFIENPFIRFLDQQMQH
jgi:hypothetical protein